MKDFEPYNVSGKLPARFIVVRYSDRSNRTKLGIIADGVSWTDGKTVLRRRGLERESETIEIFDQLEDVKSIYKTATSVAIRWLDAIVTDPTNNPNL